MQLANEIMASADVATYKLQKPLHILDRRYEALGMQEMTTLQSGSTEFDEIESYLLKSVGSTHRIDYEVHNIFRVERNGEADRLNESAFANLGVKSNRRLLWHGSRCTNFGGILSKGLRIAPPEAPSSGYSECFPLSFPGSKPKTTCLWFHLLLAEYDIDHVCVSVWKGNLPR